MSRAEDLYAKYGKHRQPFSFLLEVRWEKLEVRWEKLEVRN
jgi:hypothetical protein